MHGMAPGITSFSQQAAMAFLAAQAQPFAPSHKRMHPPAEETPSTNKKV